MMKLTIKTTLMCGLLAVSFALIGCHNEPTVITAPAAPPNAAANPNASVKMQNGGGAFVPHPTPAPAGVKTGIEGGKKD